MKEAIAAAKISLQEVACIGITNQRETVVVWDRKPGSRYITRLGGNAAERISRRPEGFRIREIIRKKTGLIIDGYFTGTKIKWILIM